MRDPNARVPPVGRQNSDRQQGTNGPRPTSSTSARPTDGTRVKKCWKYDKVGHLAKDCPTQVKQEGTGRTVKNPSARMVTSDDPTLYLLDDDSMQVNQVRIQDQGSQPQCAQVSVGGVPMKGVVDSGSDITILGGEMFKKVVSVACLCQKDFQPPDKTPRNYDQQPFTVDGRIDIDVAFQDKTMKTTVYVKMDVSEDLLLSEGVCRQLGILTYYPEVQPLRIRRGEKTSEKSAETKETDC